MRRLMICGTAAIACLVLAGPLSAQNQERDEKKAYTDPEKTDADFAFQGEFVGPLGDRGEFGVQIIALGNGEFRGVGYEGGLPGAGGQDREEKQADGSRQGDVVELRVPGEEARIVIKEDQLQILQPGGDVYATLEKVNRQSPTLGAKPPAGAKVLFDGESVEHFREGAKMTDDGLLMQGVRSKLLVQSYRAHIEFRLPYMPRERGQGRGNSGFYVQGRYEIQMLDSFGLDGKDNECGGIYKIAKPKLNMCFPPLSWQTYDIDFTAPEYEGEKKVNSARLTVRHNGVVIHDDLELPQGTPGGVGGESPEPGPAIFLQDHGDPVRYRNLWIVEKP